jgi:hypothetical protein
MARNLALGDKGVGRDDVAAGGQSPRSRLEVVCSAWSGRSRAMTVLPVTRGPPHRLSRVDEQLEGSTVATLYQDTGYSLTHLHEDIQHGNLALPDIQRPFVWSSTKIRDLFDSMYRGYRLGP